MFPPSRAVSAEKNSVRGATHDSHDDSQGVPLLSDKVAGDGQHGNASVLELHGAAPEQRCIVLSVAERVKHTVRLYVRTEHVIHCHLRGDG